MSVTVYRWTVICIPFWFSLATAQVVDYEKYIELDVELDGTTDLIDYLEVLSTFPLNLSDESLKGLRNNPLIEPATLIAIKKYKQSGKTFQSVKDIHALSLGKEQEALLIRMSALDRSNAGSDRYILRSRTIRKSPENDFPDSPFKVYTRGSFVLKGGITGGMTMERDPGEEDFNDYFSFYLADRRSDGSYSRILGDYSIEAGQGLVFWQNGPIRRNGAPMLSTRRKARGIIPYRSAVESRSLRGAAGIWQFGDMDILLFASIRDKDAALSDSGEVLNFRESGLHRTDGELEGKNLVNEKVFGIRNSWNSEYIRIGANLASVSFDIPVNPEDKPEKINNFSGTKNRVYSADYEIEFKEISLFGEMANTGNEKSAQVHGMRAEYEQFSIGIVFRDYDDGFIGVRGNPFGGADNERGVYTAVRLKLGANTTLSGYRDLYKKHWITSTALSPSRTEDYGIELSRRIFVRHSASLRFWGSNSGKNEVVEDKYEIERRLLTEKERSRTRLKFRFALSPGFSLGWRFDMASSKVNSVNERGYALTANADINMNKRRDINLSATIFDTESFASRIYVYERDLPGVLRNIPVYHRGYRIMVLAREKFNAYFSTSIKLERYLRRQGTNETSESRIGIQIDISI
ncbi:MAG: hypothetical protein IID12_07655 [Candidatus Marinimicrobia bacterium]|nr:hypothetical protein [Candidatus Neomarinimicrobiota bacterium]